jgi:hypothetical protein
MNEPSTPRASVQIPPPTARRWFAFVCVGIVAYAVLDIVAQLLPPHYSPIRDAESDLAVGPYGWIMTVNFVLRGAIALAFLAGFAGTVVAEGGSWRSYDRGVGAFLVWGVGAFLLAAFPTDVPATPISWHGAIHLVVAVLAFIGGALGTYWLATRFERSPVLRPVHGWATALAIVCLLLLVVELLGGLLVARLADRYGGLIERLFLGSVLLWMFLVAAYLYRAHGTVTPGSDPGPSTEG